MNRAWQEAWDRLSTTDFIEGRQLTEDVAPVADIKPVSLLTLLHRQAKAGVLEVEQRPVVTTVTRAYPVKVTVGTSSPVEVPNATRTTTFEALRKRAFFRIAQR